MSEVDGESVRLALLGLPQSDERSVLRLIETAGKLYVMYVEDDEWFDVFFKDMLDVKRVVKVITDLYDCGGLSYDNYCRQIRQKWLHGVVDSFVGNYGVHYVPQDTRKAIDSFCEGLDDHVVDKWPMTESVRMHGASNIQYLHIRMHEL